MNIFQSHQRRSGFTFLDLMIVLVIAGVLLAWLLEMRYRGGRTRHTDHGRTHCLSNLKQVGLAALMWASDHDEKFPWQVPEAEGGTKEYLESPNTFVHFLAMSNEMNTPKILACPSDSGRTRTNDWAAFLSAHLSYFVGLDADPAKPRIYLSGDRSLSTNSSWITGTLTVSSNSTLTWAHGIHQEYGNIGFSDGSVEQMSNSALKSYLPKDDSSFRILMP